MSSSNLDISSKINQKYKCSIFCTIYKGEKFIDGYLEDVLKQTIFNDIEFILLDCGSPENEKDHIKKLTDLHNNIIYHRLDNDPGLYQSWNIAIKMCSSSIIGNWNVDDRKSTNGIEMLYNRLSKKTQVDVVYGITYVSYVANEKYEDNEYNVLYPYLPHSLENLLRNNSPHCMPLWRKNLHDRFGYFDESYMSAADGEFWLRCAFGGATIELINHPVGLYYENPTGRSTNPEHLEKCLEEVRRSREPYINYSKLPK
jgi:glycosyltransferase involved in cell wall biosynthesis